MRYCTTEKCDKPIHGYGMCGMHYRRWRKLNGKDLYIPKPKRIRPKAVYNTYEYRAWIRMKIRVKPNKSKNYKYYKHIDISNEWKHDFNLFLHDMGIAPSKSHSIDRVDNNKGYSKDNCRWATPLMQTLNRRKNSNNSSGYVGVSRYGNTYRSWVSIEYKSIYVGQFQTPEEAAWMRDQYMIELHGEHAILNFEYK